MVITSRFGQSAAKFLTCSYFNELYGKGSEAKWVWAGLLPV
jgi:hypothetical protein